ncbi:MAG: hypothetical protein HUJ22_09040 [Gracilimonas sp.]|uniref:hypothetical protein n=1 Tax=Gracilimonas sp. TaxID=1974203 RepID=UPI0019C822FD|nr:hypothetical protein [Gracilimonas sp.]MBD3616707.1 hypothetical protein [Gracilimonas sp.]
MSEPILVIELVNNKKGETSHDQPTYLENREFHHLEINEVAEIFSRSLPISFEKAHKILTTLREYLLTTLTLEEGLEVEGIGFFQLIAVPKTEEDKEKLYKGETDGVQIEILFRPYQNFEKKLSFLSEN